MDRLVRGGAEQDHSDRSGSPLDFERSYDNAQARGGTSTEAERAQVDGHLARLARTIEFEVIPRLMLAHRTEGVCPPVPSPGLSVRRDDVQAFARLVLSEEDDVVLACVEDLRARGMSIETIYTDLLAATARYLGDLWDADMCDFTDVTVGLGRLQHVLRTLSQAYDAAHPMPSNGLRLLLLPCPGEQHTFGLVMVGEFFRHAGWEVAGGSWEAAVDAAECVSQDHYDVVGFSLAAEMHLDILRDSIQAVRQASINTSVGIIVGGPLFMQRPDRVSYVGADLVSCDGRQAPSLAERLVAQRPRAG